MSIYNIRMYPTHQGGTRELVQDKPSFIDDVLEEAAMSAMPPPSVSTLTDILSSIAPSVITVVAYLLIVAIVLDQHLLHPVSVPMIQWIRARLCILLNASVGGVMSLVAQGSL